MKLHVESAAGTYRISAYGSGYVKVNGERLTRSVVILPDELIRDWPPQSWGELGAGHLELVAARAPEIVLLGTGATQRFPDPPLIESLSAAGIGVEIMDTGAACRTYNIIMAEGRQVAAALLMIRE